MAPLYRAVFSAIQDKIYSGEWAEGALMPPEFELCATFGVSRITVRRALDELSRLGFVERIQGRGTYVRNARLRSGAANDGFIETMRIRGRAVSSRLLSRALAEAGPGIALALDLDPHHEIWHFRRLRLVDGRPMAIMNTYVEKSLGDRMLAFDLERESFYDLYARILGEPIARTDGVVSAVLPDAESCAILGLPEGSAQLWYRSTGRLADGSPVEACYSLFDAACYEFAVSGFRLKEEDVPPGLPDPTPR